MPPYEIPDKIDAAFVQGLVDRNQPESKHFEFKQQLNIKNDSQKQRFLAHATAIANTEGGFLIYGIKQGDGQLKGKASEIYDVSCSESDDDLRLLIDDLLWKGISPGIVDPDIEIVPMGSDKRVLVIHVAVSKSIPHMVTHSGLNKIYKRRSSRIYSPDLEELRQMFFISESLETGSDKESLETIKYLRKERIDSIRRGETPIELKNGPLLVFHIFPHFFGRAQQDIDLSKMGSDFRFTFDEIVKNGKDYFITVSQDGCFEFACSLVTMNEYAINAPENEKVINAFDVEGAILYLCMSEVFRYFALMKQGSSRYFMLSLLNVEGFKLELAERVKFELHSVDFNAYKDPQPIRQRDLIVPEFLVEDPEVSIDFLQNALRPAIDKMWRASGWPRSKKLRHRR